MQKSTTGSPTIFSSCICTRDGSAIEVVLTGDDSDTERRLQLDRFDIDSDALAEIITLAGAAGLKGGGMRALVEAPDGAQVQDGGQVVFSAKLDGVAAARAVDQLVSDPAWNREGDRAAYQAPFDAIEDVGTTGDRAAVAFERWAIVSAPLKDG